MGVGERGLHQYLQYLSQYLTDDYKGTKYEEIQDTVVCAEIHHRLS